MSRPDGRVPSVCTLVYTQTLYYSTPFLSPSSPSSDDVHPLRAALHAGRRLSAHVLCGGQRQVPPPPAAHGGGVRVHCDKQHSGGHSLCTCGMCCVFCTSCHTHVCSWLIGRHNTVGDTRQTSVCCTVLSLLVWQY